jgi:DNA polymerase III alpha subunit
MYLNCHSFHSLRYGTIPLDKLIEEAVSCDVKAMALTDINTVTGIYDFIRECDKVGIKPLVGMEFRCNHQFRYIGLAKNAEGLGEMNRFLTNHNFSGEPLPLLAPKFESVFVIYTLENAPEFLRENEFIGIRTDEVSKLFTSEHATKMPKMVVFQPVTFKTKREFNLHKILRAIDTNIILSKLTETDYCRTSEKMLPLESLLPFYENYPEIIVNTQKIIDSCDFQYDFTTPKNKKFFTENREGDIKKLTELAYEGLIWRYGENHELAKKRVEKELKIIDELEFSGYFLITWDITRYSTNKGFMHIGRGSGANSIIAYCLGITDICPLELDLYFERFLNLNRKSPPDFDIDWSWKERNTILEYILTNTVVSMLLFAEPMLNSNTGLFLGK